MSARAEAAPGSSWWRLRRSASRHSVDNVAVHLFHYHLVTSELRDVEARYVGKLGFDLVARYGRIGENHVSAEPGSSWEALDGQAFRARLSRVRRGAGNLVAQPGHC